MHSQIASDLPAFTAVSFVSLQNPLYKLNTSDPFPPYNKPKWN